MVDRSPLAIARRLAAVLAAVAVLAGCSLSKTVPGPFTQLTGTLAGTLVAVGGAAPGTPRPLPGTLSLRARTGRTFHEAARADGKFAAQVPPGSYTVTGRSPLYQGGAVDCRASGPLTVTVGHTTLAVVSCQER